MQARKLGWVWAATLLLSSGCAGDAIDPVGDQDPVAQVDLDQPMVDSLQKPLGEISRRIVEANAEVAKDWNLLARVEVQPNELLELYEPRPGLIIASGAGAPEGDMKFADVRGYDVETLWAEVSHGAALPPALADAVERSYQRSPETRVIPATRPATGMLAPAPAAPRARWWGGWCDTGYYSSGWGACPAFDFNVCWDNVTGHSWAYHDDAMYGYTNVCAADGLVLLKVTADEGWVTQGTWTVPENTARYVDELDSACAHVWDDCPTFRSEVHWAEGDRYHFRFRALDE